MLFFVLSILYFFLSKLLYDFMLFFAFLKNFMSLLDLIWKIKCAWKQIFIYFWLNYFMHNNTLYINGFYSIFVLKTRNRWRNRQQQENITS